MNYAIDNGVYNDISVYLQATQTERRLKIYRQLTIDSETLQIISEDSYEYSGPLLLADRSMQNRAGQAATTAGNVGSTEGANANTERGAILPGLIQEATHPTGYTPTQKNQQLVAGEQGAGGANAGLTGEAMLHMARTRNAGGYGAALDEAARQKQNTLSQNALNVENKSSDLAQKKQQFAQGELGNLYGMDTNAMLKAYGLVPEDINAGVNAGKSGWLQDANSIIQTLSGASKAGAGAAGGG